MRQTCQLFGHPVGTGPRVLAVNTLHEMKMEKFALVSFSYRKLGKVGRVLFSVPRTGHADPPFNVDRLVGHFSDVDIPQLSFELASIFGVRFRLRSRGRFSCAASSIIRSLPRFHRNVKFLCLWLSVLSIALGPLEVLTLSGFQQSKTLIVRDRKPAMVKSRENSQNGCWFADPSSLQTLMEARPYSQI